MSDSIWGGGDKDTLALLKDTRIDGKWLNLSAGDGRYNLELLKKAAFVIASDIDRLALENLWDNTPEELRSKLELKVFDVTKRFPFDNVSFDGVFCTGTLHLFPKETLKEVISEITRVLKPNCKVIIDFATDVKRILPNGKLYIIEGEPQYTSENANLFLRILFKDYDIQIQNSEVPEEQVDAGDMSYKFSCRFLLLTARKQANRNPNRVSLSISNSRK